MRGSRAPYVMSPPLKDAYEAWVAPTGHVITSEVQRMAALCASTAGSHGVTGIGLAKALEPGDEGALSRWSPALSHLHKKGIVVRLDEKRDGHAVYVLPQHVNGRTEVPRHKHHCDCLGVH